MRDAAIAWVIGGGVLVLLAATLVPADICSGGNTFCGAAATPLLDALLAVILLAFAYSCMQTATISNSRKMLLSACAFVVLGIAMLLASWQSASNARAFFMSAGLLAGSVLLLATMVVHEGSWRHNPRVWALITAAACAVIATLFLFNQERLPAFGAGAEKTLLANAMALFAVVVLVATAVHGYTFHRQQQTHATRYVLIGILLLAFSTLAWSQSMSTPLQIASRLLRFAAGIAFVLALLHRRERPVRKTIPVLCTARTGKTGDVGAPHTAFFIALVLTVGALLLTILPGGPVCGTVILSTLCEWNAQIGTAIHLIFGIIMLVTAYLTTRSTLATGSRRVHLTACAFVVLGISGLILTFENVADQNTRAFALSVSYAIAAILLISAHFTSDTKLRHTVGRDVWRIVISSIAALIAIIAWPHYLPAFYATGEKTLLARMLMLIASALLLASTLWFYGLYRKNGHKVTFWFASGTLLLALSAFVWYLGVTSLDPFSWAVRLLRLSAALSFLLALSHREPPAQRQPPNPARRATALVLVAIAILFAAAARYPNLICAQPTASAVCQEAYAVAGHSLLFFTIIMLALVAFALNAARATRSRRLVMIACAFEVIGIGALFAAYEWYIGGLSVAIFAVPTTAFTGAVVLSLATFVLPDARIPRRPARYILLTGTLTIAVILGFIRWEPVLPAFYTPSGKTLLYILVSAFASVLLILSTIWYYRLCGITQSRITYWFYLGTLFYTLHVSSLLLWSDPLDSFSWLVRLFRILAAFAFLFAVLRIATTSAQRGRRYASLAIIGICIALVAIIYPAYLCAGPTCAAYPSAVSVINGLFGLFCLLASYAALKQAAMTRNKGMCLRACAYAVLGIGGIGTALGWSVLKEVSANIAVFSISAALLAAAIMVLLAERAKPADKCRNHPRRALILAICASATVLFLYVLFHTPVFSDAAGRTLIARMTFAAAGIVFAFAATRHYIMFRTTSSTMARWLMIGDILLALSAFAILLGVSAYDQLSWLARILRVLGALALLRAVAGPTAGNLAAVLTPFSGTAKVRRSGRTRR